MSGLQLHDLRQVPDETLYLRLIVLRKHFPADFDAEDYDYRRNVWEAANRAVQAEIRRRRAEPPKWWVLERGEPPGVRQRRFGAVAAYLVGGGLAVLLSGIPYLAVPLMLTVLASGATWLVPEVLRNQRQPFLRPIPRPRTPRD
ncbi:hypothetical protein ACFQZ4_08220 [Catellatospora coxensis]|uniref:Uncharacterized protein n=1 Tax=Catellatospora coxensis TaxID=310354 RepID=A0A8J3PAD0_9ACTN|nr:hypothetical protein [Catellatospora coxensis]GIG09692.1 hypothetical protein Cco03nite_63920 [Catellatospora coxensis]